VPGAGAAVDDGAAALAGHCQAPPGARVSGHRSTQAAAVLDSQRAEPGHLPRRAGQAEPAAEWHRQVDHPGHGRSPGHASAAESTGEATGAGAAGATGRFLRGDCTRWQQGGHWPTGEQREEHLGAHLVGGSGQPRASQPAGQFRQVMVGG
jgi:hypothetical protein